MKVKDLLSDKDLRFVSIEATESLTHAHELMKKQQIHQLPVVEAKKLVGLITADTILDAVMLSPTNFTALSVQDVMVKDIPLANAETELEELVGWMQDKKLLAIPYEKDGEYQALITRSDLLGYFQERLWDNDLVEKAVEKTEMSLSHPLMARLMKLLADIGI